MTIWLGSQQSRQREADVSEETRFGLKPSTGSSSGLVFPAFKSLFQSDHLGVEIVLAAHEGVLQDENILIDSERLRGHQTVPFGPRWTGLIIDDFFALRAEHRDSLPLSSFACRALALARDAYAKHGIEGSEEKDIEAADYVKAAGAEIDPGTPRAVLDSAWCHLLFQRICFSCVVFTSRQIA